MNYAVFVRSHRLPTGDPQERLGDDVHFAVGKPRPLGSTKVSQVSAALRHLGRRYR